MIGQIVGQVSVKQRKRQVKARPIGIDGERGLGQNGLARVHLERGLDIVGPRARVQVEYDMILAAVPVLELVEPFVQMTHEIRAQSVSIERVQRQHEQTRLVRVVRDAHMLAVAAAAATNPRPIQVVDHVGVDLCHDLFRLPVDVDFEAGSMTSTQIKARFHCAFRLLFMMMMLLHGF